jgi:hypothetical protein
MASKASVEDHTVTQVEMIEEVYRRVVVRVTVVPTATRNDNGRREMAAIESCYTHGYEPDEDE